MRNRLLVDEEIILRIYNHELQTREALSEVREDEREKVLEELKSLLQIEYLKNNIDWSEMCVLEKIIKELKEQK